ncbi:signal peptidase I [Streptomyces sp. NPDC054933]
MPSAFGCSPPSAGSTVKRVIGVGGDHVVERPGAQVTVNGRPLAESYVKGGAPYGGPPYDVVVPAGRLFLLGDHRADSYDSRYFLGNHSGTVAATDVLARVIEDPTVLFGLALTELLGLLLAPTGLAPGIAARVARKRSLRTLAPPALV